MSQRSRHPERWLFFWQICIYTAMQNPTLPSMLGRAFLLSCQRCGERDVRKSWFRMRERCPRCQLHLERGEPDYWLGAYAINLVVAEGLAAVAGVITLYSTWPSTAPGLTVAISAAVLLPLVFFPFSRLLWLALDLRLRPLEPGD
jgi:uncharacterized protein (DUF983 family)